MKNISRILLILIHLIILFIIGTFLFFDLGYPDYFRCQKGKMPIMPANQCYFECAEKGFFSFPFCVKQNNCEAWSSIIN